MKSKHLLCVACMHEPYLHLHSQQTVKQAELMTFKRKQP